VRGQRRAEYKASVPWASLPEPRMWKRPVPAKDSLAAVLVSVELIGALAGI